MKYSILIVAFTSILFQFACAKEEYERKPKEQPRINYFKYEPLSPVVIMNSYDSIKLFNCGLTPFPFNNQKAYIFDVDEDYNSDFRITIQHSRHQGSGCPYYLYKVTIQGIASNSLIAAENEFAIKFESDSLISSDSWIPEATVVKTDISPLTNHVFYGKKYIGFSIKRENQIHYGYFKIEFSQTELYLMSYAINLANSNTITGGQTE